MTRLRNTLGSNSELICNVARSYGLFRFHSFDCFFDFSAADRRNCSSACGSGGCINSEFAICLIYPRHLFHAALRAECKVFSCHWCYKSVQYAVFIDEKLIIVVFLLTDIHLYIVIHKESVSVDASLNKLGDPKSFIRSRVSEIILNLCS